MTLQQIHEVEDAIGRDLTDEEIKAIGDLTDDSEVGHNRIIVLIQKAPLRWGFFMVNHNCDIV